jgi:hypothetical protein
MHSNPYQWCAAVEAELGARRPSIFFFDEEPDEKLLEDCVAESS